MQVQIVIVQMIILSRLKRLRRRRPKLCYEEVISIIEEKPVMQHYDILPKFKDIIEHKENKTADIDGDNCSEMTNEIEDSESESEVEQNEEKDPNQQNQQVEDQELNVLNEQHEREISHIEDPHTKKRPRFISDITRSPHGGVGNRAHQEIPVTDNKENHGISTSGAKTSTVATTTGAKIGAITKTAGAGTGTKVNRRLYRMITTNSLYVSKQERYLKVVKGAVMLTGVYLVLSSALYV